MVKLLLHVIAALPLLVQAAPNFFPRSALNLPPNAQSIAVDEETNSFIAFDSAGKELGSFPMDTPLTKRQASAGTCTPMTQDDIGQVPGIERLREEANALWGTGDREEVVNDKDFRDSPANICADDNGVIITYNSEPSCRDTDNESSGTLEGGTITLENSEGVTVSTNTEVTRESSFALGTSISAGFSFPQIVDVTAGITTTSTFTNTQGNSNSITQDTRTTQQIQQPVDAGVEECKVVLRTRTCNIVGQGELPMIATGMLWFQYHERTQGHFKWGIIMESVLPDPADRSSNVAFKSTGSVTSSGHFSSSGCTKPEQVVAV